LGIRDRALAAIQCLAMAEPTAEELKARIAELEQKLSSRRPKTLEFRVSEKGGVSVYGLGRFPVTLYYEQWMRLLGTVDELRAFIEENKSKLKTKDAE
jgi:ABC-type Fe3+-hydroxamate transport system substrate-binding protein